MASEEFLEYFIVKYLLVQLVLIICAATYLLIRHKRQIIRQIRKDTLVYISLAVIMLLSTVVRIGIIDQKSALSYQDSLDYAIISYGIFESGKFEFVCDPPGYPFLVSIFMKLVGVKTSILSIANAFFSILNLILIFILIQSYFKDKYISLLSTLLVAISPYYIAASVKAYPFMISLHFILLSMIMLYYSVKTGSKILFIVTGICLGFASHIYHYEIIFVIFSLIYLLMINRKRLFLKLDAYILLLGVLISIFPFMIMQKVSTNTECITYHMDNDLFKANLVSYNERVRSQRKDILCVFTRNYCHLYRLSYLFSDAEIQNYYVNDHKSHLLSYLTFLFGYGKQNRNLDKIQLLQSNVKDSVFNWTYLVHIFFMVFLLLFLIKRTKDTDRLKHVYFLLIVLCLYVLFWSVWMDLFYIFMIPIEVIALIPLISLSIIKLINMLKINNTIKISIVALIVLILFSALFVEDNAFEILKKNAKKIYVRSSPVFDGKYICRGHMEHPSLDRLCFRLIEAMKESD